MPSLPASVPRGAARTAACAAIAALCAQAAAVDVASLDRFKGDISFKAYLRGVGTGWHLANEALESRRQPPLFCMPPSVALSADDYLDLIEAKLKQPRTRGGDVDGDAPVETMLLMALEETYPCRR